MVWPLLGDLDDSGVLVGLVVLAKRLVVADTVPVISKGWVVLVRLVAVVRTELGELVLSLAVVEAWLVPVVCCDVVGRTVLPELVAMLPVAEVCPVVRCDVVGRTVLPEFVAMLPVPVVCPVEEAVPLILGVTRLALEVCMKPVDRWVLLTLRPVPDVCPGVVERTLPRVLVACPVLVACSETIEELLWLVPGVLSAPAEVTEERVAVVCCDAVDVLTSPLIACSEGAEVVIPPVTGGA